MEQNLLHQQRDIRNIEMHDWLTSHGIEYPEHTLKHKFLSLIKLSNHKPKYVIDEMAKTAGHEVVRIPPYHCELNPIELCWSQVKRYIKEHNKLYIDCRDTLNIWRIK